MKAIARFLCISVMFWTCPLWAELAASAAGKADIEMALLKDLSEKGDPVARLGLGQKYLAGEGVAPDAAKGFTLVKSAAEQGLYTAQSSLAYLFSAGQGTAANPGEALFWTQVALTRFPESQAPTALIELRKQCETQVPADQAKAWAEKAKNWKAPEGGYSAVTPEALALVKAQAEKGNAVAQAMLGNFLYSGQGTPRNLDEAISWYQKSWENGFSESAFWLGLLFSEAQNPRFDAAEAFFWLSRAAEKESDPGQKERILERRTEMANLLSQQDRERVEMKLKPAR